MKELSIAGHRVTLRRAILLAAIALDLVLILTGASPDLASLLTLCLVAWACWVLFRKARSKLIWKVRNRLIVTYLFIFLVPIALVLAFFLVAGWALTAQFAGYMVGSAMQHREASIETPARLLARELPADRIAIVEQLTATGIPSFSALVTGSQNFRYPADSPIQMPPGDWKDYTGVVYKNLEPYLMSLVTRGHNRSLILVPLTREVLEQLVPGLGSLGLPEDRTPQELPMGPPFTLPDRKSDLKSFGIATYKNAVAGRIPPKKNLLDFQITGFAPIQIAYWYDPDSGAPSFMLVVTRLSAVLGVIFPAKIMENLVWIVVLFIVITALLSIALVISLLIGASMTRTITVAVHDLYEGTTRIGAGIFAHRIPVKGNDQLADLGKSFNNMAGQLQQFVVVTKEKERLQSEIAIASEVQTRLFPLKPPFSKTVEMLGVCHAARSVSGDYYDYFATANGELAFALGDVAGKGISAALLMASIQSIMRTQLSDGSVAVTPANTVARLNRLLYANTSPEKYATFFFGLYNEHTRRMLYTNAGHLPPLLIHEDNYTLLDVTGSVVGAFPSLHYEEQSIPIEAGDLLVAYTDGITEPENAYGEDFGAERLADVILRHRDACPDEIVAKVLEAVRHWDTSTEQADDMTLMIVKGLP